MKPIDLFGPPSSKAPSKARRSADRSSRPVRKPGEKPVPRTSAREAVLTCLARREHSQKELRDKLRRQGHEAEAIEEALTYAIEAGYQSDARYAASMVRYKGGRMGERKMRLLLNQQRLAPDVVAQAMGEAAPEIQRAIDTLQGRFGSKAPTPELRKKATQFMMGRGFGYEAIRNAWKVVFESKDVEDFLTY